MKVLQHGLTNQASQMLYEHKQCIHVSFKYPEWDKHSNQSVFDRSDSHKLVFKKIGHLPNTEKVRQIMFVFL